MHHAANYWLVVINWLDLYTVESAAFTGDGTTHVRGSRYITVVPSNAAVLVAVRDRVVRDFMRADGDYFLVGCA